MSAPAGKAKVQLNPCDNSLNCEITNEGLALSSLSEGGFGYMFGGARANVGVLAGDYTLPNRLCCVGGVSTFPGFSKPRSQQQTVVQFAYRTVVFPPARHWCTSCERTRYGSAAHVSGCTRGRISSQHACGPAGRDQGCKSSWSWFAWHSMRCCQLGVCTM